VRDGSFSEEGVEEKRREERGMSGSEEASANKIHTETLRNGERREQKMSWSGASHNAAR
jgi:hypothetical protein